jgi:hypothetical protein
VLWKMLEVACDGHLESPGFGIAGQIVIPHKIWPLSSWCLATCWMRNSSWCSGTERREWRVTLIMQVEGCLFVCV